MSRIKKIVFAALAAAALTGAAGAVHLDRPVQGSSSVSASIQSSSAASEVVRMTNSARSQNGYATLVEDGALSDAAAVRAREIARSFSHTRPSGASFSSALSESGVSYLRAGENIASGQTSASEVVNAWMNSPGHRANILNSSYSRIGSASVNIDGTLYWVRFSRSDGGRQAQPSGCAECETACGLHKSQRFCHLHGLFPPPCRRFSATLPEHLATKSSASASTG